MSAVFPSLRSPSKAVWVLAYLLSPALPFLCLLYSRAIKPLECVSGVAAALVAHIGLITVLGKTDGDRLQIFVVLLLGFSLYLLVLWQYLAGRRAGLWTEEALKQWSQAGRFFGILLGIALAAAIGMFQVRDLLEAKSPASREASPRDTFPPTN